MCFNCAAVTKYGQDELVYRENITDLSVANASEAAKRNVLFIELSTAQVYEGDKVRLHICILSSVSYIIVSDIFLMGHACNVMAFAILE